MEKVSLKHFRIRRTSSDHYEDPTERRDMSFKSHENGKYRMACPTLHENSYHWNMAMHGTLEGIQNLWFYGMLYRVVWWVVILP